MTGRKETGMTYRDIAKELKRRKKYRIVISGGLSNEHFVKAPNKTIARSMAKGELNPWIKIIKIEEVSA